MREDCLICLARSQSHHLLSSSPRCDSAPYLTVAKGHPESVHSGSYPSFTLVLVINLTRGVYWIVMAISFLFFASALVYAIYRYIIHPLFLSPLSRIPSAHVTASLSPIWILWLRYIGKENVTVYEAHKRLGPLVRLGPNEVSVNCVDGGIRTVRICLGYSERSTRMRGEYADIVVRSVLQ